MNTPTYDLLTEPWIPVLRADGSAAQVGLREALLQAHEIQGLTGETPLVVAALYRLLLAVLYRALGAPTLDSWEEIWRQGRFPTEALEAYLERWHARFDLFHPEHPFLQWPDERVQPKSVSALVPHMASGNNATLFDHHHAGEEVWLTPAEAARALLVALGFGLAGGMGMAPKDSSDAPWARGVIFLAEGNTLFETLMFNYLPMHYFEFESDPIKDRPFWEADNPFEPQRAFPLGITDYLTWPNRGLRLLPEQIGTQWRVRKVTMVKGLRLGRADLDPYKHYLPVENVKARSGWRLLRFQERRSLWRDSVTFLRFRDTAHRAPRPLLWMSDLAEEDIIERHARYRLMALGWATGPIDTEPRASGAKIHFYREEHFPLPVDYLVDPDLVEVLSEALNLAETRGRLLAQKLRLLAIYFLYPEMAKPDGCPRLVPEQREKVDDLTGHWGRTRAYWASLEIPFWGLLQGLPQEGTKALKEWQSAVQREFYHSFEQSVASLGQTPRSLKAAAFAESKRECY